MSKVIISGADNIRQAKIQVIQRAAELEKEKAEANAVHAFYLETQIKKTDKAITALKAALAVNGQAIIDGDLL